MTRTDKDFLETCKHSSTSLSFIHQNIATPVTSAHNLNIIIDSSLYQATNTVPSQPDPKPNFVRPKIRLTQKFGLAAFTRKFIFTAKIWLIEKIPAEIQ